MNKTDSNFENMEKLISFILEKNDREIGHIPAIKSDNIKITYSQLKEKVLNVILILEKQNLPQNLCIGLRFNNQITQLIFTLSLFKMGIKQTSISPFNAIKIQVSQINEIGVDLIIQNIPFNNIIKKETFYIDNNLEILKYKFKNINVNNNLSKDTALTLLGSGTTGKPKLIELSSLIHATQVKNDLINCNFNINEIVYFFSQFSLRRSIIALLKGSTLLIPLKKPKDFISFCIENKVDHLLLTGDQALNILLKDIKPQKNSILLPNLKSCILSSTMIKEPLRKSVLSYITKNLFISYGTNEFGNICEAKPEDIKKTIGTVGKVNKNISLKIVNDEGEECKTGEIGNILVKTSNMINSYSNNIEASKNNFTKEGNYPGDIGRLTLDGNLIVEGRKDDMMIFYGENIYPREIESVLESHPNVIESAVFPLTINNQEGIPFAVVVIKVPMEEKELMQYCDKRLGWKKPQRIFTSKKLPKNSASKVLKKDLALYLSKFIKV